MGQGIIFLPKAPSASPKRSTRGPPAAPFGKGVRLTPATPFGKGGASYTSCALR
jgi:hypothetical protein